MNNTKPIYKFRKPTHKDEPGLILTREYGNLNADTVFIGTDLKVIVTSVKGKCVRLKFIDLNGKHTNIRRGEVEAILGTEKN